MKNVPLSIWWMCILMMSSLVANPLLEKPPATVEEAQGLVSVLAKGDLGWHWVSQGQGLQLGTWLKTATRGPHGVMISLKGGSKVTLGPGTMIELVDSKTIKLMSGDCSLEGDGSVAVQSPDGQEKVKLEKGQVVSKSKSQWFEGHIEASDVRLPPTSPKPLATLS